MILTLSVVAAERGVLAAGSFGQHAMCFRWGRAAAHEVDDEPQLLQLVARVHALIALAPRRDDDAVAVLPLSNGRRFDAQHRRHRADRVDRLTARLRIVARAHATVSSDLHREQSVDPGQRQQTGHTARSVHDRQLRTSSDARVVELDKEADAGGIDEHHLGTVQLDIATDALQSGADGRDHRGVQFAPQRHHRHVGLGRCHHHGAGLEAAWTSFKARHM